jgi:proline iminopeptidase
LNGVIDGYAAVPGARLYHRSVGSGAPLVVLHGGPDFNHHYLLPELDDLASTLRLIYYDQRGRGKSSEGVAPEDVSIESEVDDLDQLRRHFGLETLSLLGHSWGCILAMEYAIRHPDRASHLVLMNPAPASHDDLLGFRERRKATEGEALARMRTIARTPAYLEGDIATEAEYYRLHYRRAVRKTEWIDPIVARLRTHFTPGGILKARAIEKRLYEQTWDQPDYDPPGRLGRFAGKTLVLHGEDDFIPPASASRIAAASVAGRLVVLEECGHFAYLERPDRVRTEIESFLSEPI